MNTKSPSLRRGACPFHVAIAALAAGCASAAPADHVHEHDVRGHEQAAAQEEALAEAHEAQYDPQATTVREHCRSRAHSDTSDIVCWTSAMNPTEQHRRDAEAHRRAAAEHRAAAKELRDAEAKACAGLAADDRDISPFYHHEDVLRVEAGSDGATVVFRPVAGLDVAMLQHIVDCHLARNAAMYQAHQSMAGMEYCPLVLPGVSGKVTQAPDGVSVELHAADASNVDEVKRRALALAPAG